MSQASRDNESINSKLKIKKNKLNIIIEEKSIGANSHTGLSDFMEKI